MMRRHDSGVTLVEVLVVLVLVGIMAAAVGLSLGPADRGDAIDREADILTARLNRAADEVLLSGAPVAFVWDGEGYHFEVPGPEGWIPHPIPLLGQDHRMTGAVDLAEDATNAGRFVVTADLLPESGTPLEIVLRTGQATSERIVFDGINAARIIPS